MRRLLTLSILSMLVVALSANVAFAQDDLNCADFGTQQEAQQTLFQDPTDPNNLDADNDGEACEDSGLPQGEIQPVADPATGEPVDPATGESVDPATEEILAEESGASIAAQAANNGFSSDEANELGLAVANGELTFEEAQATISGEDEMVPQTAPVEETAAPTAQYANESDEMTALPDTGGFSLGGIAAGAGALLVAGGLLLRRRLT